MLTPFRTITAGILLAMSASAQADILAFSGSLSGTSTFVGPDASCAPLLFRSVINPASSTGTSSLGDFSYSTNTCLALGGVTSAGSFVMDFGVDALNGTFTGAATPSAIPGVSDTSWLFTALGGTGRFDGATGTFGGTGVTDARTPPTLVTINFDGSLDAPAVPEPATWAMMLMGFGGTGLMLRRRPRSVRQIA